MILFALRGLLIVLSLLVIFHLLVLIRIIPFKIIWGSKISGESRMYHLEIVSIVVSLLMLTIVAIKARIINLPLNAKIVTVLLWMMFCFFCLNTVGNLFSNNLFEKMVFAPITFVLALFTILVVRKGRQAPAV